MPDPNATSDLQSHHIRRQAPTQAIRLAELLSALSYALDLVEGQPAGHCVRCCWIGIHIGRQIGLSEPQIWELYYTLLLKDLGCASNAARVCQLFMTDDLIFKRDVKTVDGSMPQALRFILSHTGMNAGFAGRIRALVNAMQAGGKIATELVETRCYRGANIARKMRFSEAVAQGIQNLDEHWDGKGEPAQIVGEAIPVYSRIALLAQVIDVFMTHSGAEAARREIRCRSGTWFDPAMVDAFEQLADDAHFWRMLHDDGLHNALYSLEPGQETKTVDEDYLDDIAAAFSEVIDSKSPYTAGHSKRVTLFTDLVAAELSIPDTRRRWLRRAALLHDIGKLGVSNSVLDKPDKLDDCEWQAMKLHALYSEQILSRIDAFADLAVIAGAHHERLGGLGYPHGRNGEAIALETRIITTADIFDALTANRPYRAAMPLEAALAIMNGMVGTQVDPNCFDALRRAVAAQAKSQVNTNAA
jgi:HD-GYP domain-containing protein (c-di-GMP phosphodiesterase class II)